MIKRMTGVAALCVVLAVGGTACGDDGDSSEGGGDVDQELVEVLMDEGAPRDVAECYVEALGDDAELIASDEEPDAEDQDRILEAIQGCTDEEGGGEGG